MSGGVVRTDLRAYGDGPYKPVASMTRAEILSEILSTTAVGVFDYKILRRAKLRRLLVSAELHRRDMVAIRRHKKRASNADDLMAMTIVPELIVRLEKLLELFGGRDA